MSADRIIIGLFVDVRAAGAYALGSAVAGGLRSLGIVTISAMIPTATAEIVREGHVAVRRLFRRYARLSLGLSLPVMTLGAVSAPLLLVAWLGERTPGSATVLVILCIAYATNLATGLSTTTAIADGRPGFVSVNAIATAVANLVLSLALAPLLGLWGVLIGTLASIGGFSVAMIVRHMRHYGLVAADARRAFGPPTLVSLTAAVPVVPIVLAVEHLAHERLIALALLAGVALLYGLPYWLVASRAALVPERLTFGAVLRWSLARGRMLAR